MKNKKLDIIFMTFIIAFIAIGIYFMYIKKEPTNSSTGEENQNNLLMSEEEMETLDESLQKEQESLLAERENFIEECKNAELHPEYHEGIYCGTYNKDFVREQCSFRDIYDMVDYEFVGYEELDDISEYVEGMNWEDKKVMWEHGFTSNVESLYVDTGLMNKDGTFNPQKRVVVKYNSDGSDGEEKIYENSELVAVKITMKFKNLSAKENRLNYYKLHYLQCNVYGEDGEIYAMSNVYSRNIWFESYSPICRTISFEKYWITNDGLPNLSTIILQPYEEYTFDLIYVVFKDELENMCLVSHFGVNRCELNYKDPGTNIVMFSYLKDTLEEK